MSREKELKQISQILLDELLAYQNVFSELPAEASFVERRLKYHRRRIASNLPSASNFQAIEAQIAKRGLTFDWNDVLRDSAARKPKRVVN